MRRTSSVALLAALLGCASAPSVVKTSSSPQPPAWVVKAPPHGGADIYFVGNTGGSESLDDGKQAALNKARGQAAEYLGVQITAIQHIIESSDVGENKNTDSVQARAAALIKGATMEDVYYEKLSRQAGATSIDRYDVWVLAKLSRAELDAEKQRQASEAKISMQNAVAWLREGQDLEKSGQVVQALGRYRKAEDATTAVASSTETGDAQLSNAGRLFQVAHEAAAAAKHKARRVIVVAAEAAGVAISEALGKKGFSARILGQDESAGLAAARSDGTPWVIVASAHTTPGGRTMGQVAATVALDVRALEAKSGAAVAALQKQAREFARTPEAAAQAAAHSAGLDAGKELAGELVKQETESQ